MLLFGLAWVASWVSSFFPVDQANVEAYLIGTTPVAQPPEESTRYASSQPALSASGPRSVTPAAKATSHSAANLLPGWLGTQGYVLELTQPLTRWLTALNPFQSWHHAALQPASLALSQTQMDLTCVPQMGAEEGPRELGAYASLQDWLTNCLLGQVQDRTLARDLAQQIGHTLMESHWQGDQIFPSLVENQPAARIGNRVLFTITPALSAQVGQNNELLASEWVNQLRVMLGAKPLSFVNSQVIMHGLETTGEFMEGDASWYGTFFHGRQTATGEIYDKWLFTAAHQTLPLDSYLKVINQANGKSLVVRINDRGPYVGDRFLDLSHGAAAYLGTEEKGVVHLRAEVMRPALNLEVQIPPQPNLRLAPAEAAESPKESSLMTMWRP